MRVRLLLGAAGSGKTFRCLAEARAALTQAPEGPALLVVAPKQMTYTLERQLLGEGPLAGYTRLHILSFERLAAFVLEGLGAVPPPMLDEEGRVMVLRGLLSRKREELQLFRASARLAGFASQLSKVLSELQREELTPEVLASAAEGLRQEEALAKKLQDLAVLLGHYLAWLKEHKLQDMDGWLSAATTGLNGAPELRPGPARRLAIGRVWVDGFAEFSKQELELLAALAPCCEELTVTLCLESVPGRTSPWLSTWFTPARTFAECRKRLGAVRSAEVEVEIVPRTFEQARFAGRPVLRQLEHRWADLQAAPPVQIAPDELAKSLRLASCRTPDDEVILAAREIRRHVQTAGARYRDIAVLARDLERYHHAIQRILPRFDIPFFLDRREPVSHHPVAELTRSALRTVAHGWQHEDWFAALKTGLAPAGEEDVDRLENEALARGWEGGAWAKPITIEGDLELTAWVNRLQKQLLPPFQKLALALRLNENRPTGPQLAVALRELWSALRVEERLAEWAVAEPGGDALRLPGAVHATVWEQMEAWLTNLELGFFAESMSLREWLPVLEAGLANLSVGVIPPALDQVLIGTVDRSRNPESKLVVVLGMNEGVFPAAAAHPPLLTESDRVELEKRNILAGATARQHLGRERFYGYVACTRARERLVMTCALHDVEGNPLSPSPYLGQVQRIFPGLELEAADPRHDWAGVEHPLELAPLMLSAPRATPEGAAAWEELARLPGLRELAAHVERIQPENPAAALDPESVRGLYGDVLRTSVSRLEQYAACPFRFFVHSGLRAEERKTFELDVKEQGSFQHDVLAWFHRELQEEGKRWRDLAPAEARQRVGRIAQSLVASYREGLLKTNAETRFTARMLTESLQDFIETVVGWMAGQYRFDPVAVELPFGGEGESPPWSLELGDGHKLELYGRIDRVDFLPETGGDEALCIVVDYKSSQKQLDPVLLENGLQLQLPAYLNVLRHWPNAEHQFGVKRLVPAGVFYVNLKGNYSREQNRREALEDVETARRLAYRHYGRFNAAILRQLDARPDAAEGDQFNYRLTKSGDIYKSCRDAVGAEAFHGLLESVEGLLRQMGRDVFGGHAEVAPYRRGTSAACDQCSYAAICRIDPWTHRFRVLRAHGKEQEATDH